MEPTKSDYTMGENEELGFIQHLFMKPGDDTARWVYADWLEEHDKGQQAKYLRSIRREKFARRVHRWLKGDKRCDPFTGRRVQMPDVILGFIEYYRNNGAWGNLHIALDDGNIRDSHVQWIVDNPRRIYRHGEDVLFYRWGDEVDEEGHGLAKILAMMTVTQRGKIDKLCGWFLNTKATGDWSNHFQASPELVAKRVANYADFLCRHARRVRAEVSRGWQDTWRWKDGDYADYERPGG